MPVITLNINGTAHKVNNASELLLLVLRNRLGRTGTKYGCGEGQCDAGTVLVQGKAKRSCRISAESVAGQKIVTIEGLSANGHLHPLQQAFLDEEAFQCGFCTSGMIMSAHAVLAAHPHPSEVQNPHWKASSSRNACCSGWRCPLAESPSIVTNFCPATDSAEMRQERFALP